MSERPSWRPPGWSTHTVCDIPGTPGGRLVRRRASSHHHLWQQGYHAISTWRSGSVPHGDDSHVRSVDGFPMPERSPMLAVAVHADLVGIASGGQQEPQTTCRPTRDHLRAYRPQ